MGFDLQTHNTSNCSEWKEWQKAAVQKNDPVNHPSHYTDGKIEVIDFIEDKQLGFHLGNAVKYISRAGKKDPTKKIQDLEKARWYLDREIQRLKNETITPEANGYPPIELTFNCDESYKKGE